MKKSAAVILVIFHLAPKGAIFYPHFYHPGKVVGEIVKPKSPSEKRAPSVDWGRELLKK